MGSIFGVGFDTTTEVVLVAATAFAALQGLPFFAVLALPLLFAGGLMLADSLDGFFMNFAFGWAFTRPARKVFYNLVITGLSIGVAFIIGTIEFLGILAHELNLSGPSWNTVSNFDINIAGLTIAGDVREHQGCSRPLLEVRQHRTAMVDQPDGCANRQQASRQRKRRLAGSDRGAVHMHERPGEGYEGACPMGCHGSSVTAKSGVMLKLS